MPAKDRYHHAVKASLMKQGWTITHDPLRLKYGPYDSIQIDLAGDRLIAAEQNHQKIAIEMKSVLSDSALSEFHSALGQFLNYRLVLDAIEPDRDLY